MPLYYKISKERFNKIYEPYLSQRAFHRELDKDHKVVKLPTGTSWTDEVKDILDQVAEQIDYL